MEGKIQKKRLWFIFGRAWISEENCSFKKACFFSKQHVHCENTKAHFQFFTLWLKKITTQEKQTWTYYAVSQKINWSFLCPRLQLPHMSIDFFALIQIISTGWNEMPPMYVIKIPYSYKKPCASSYTTKIKSVNLTCNYDRILGFSHLKTHSLFYQPLSHNNWCSTILFGLSFLAPGFRDDAVDASWITTGIWISRSFTFQVLDLW